MRQFETAGNRGAALYIAVELGNTEAVDRLLEQIIEYGVRASSKGHLDKVIESLVKAVPYNPALGKKVVKVVEEERGVAYVKDDVEYIAYAGKIAAILGEKTYAEWAIDCCLDEKKYLEAGEIAALLGEVTATENILAKAYQGSNERNTPSFTSVGYTIAALAKHSPQAAERIWETVKKQAPKSVVNATASTILANLLSHPTFR